MKLTLTLAFALLGVIGIVWYGIFVPRRLGPRAPRQRLRARRRGAATGPAAPRLTTLRPAAFALAVGAGVATFAALLAPVLEGDRPVQWAIYWSYLPIPLAVTILLAAQRRLSLRATLVDSLLAVVAKFCLTAIFLVSWWTLRGPLEPASPVESSGDLAAVAPPGDDGGVSPTTTVHLEHRGDGLSPSATTLSVGGELAVRSVDDRLHALRATDSEGRRVFNRSLPPGATIRWRPTRAYGPLTLDCAVHADTEPVSRITVTPPAD